MSDVDRLIGAYVAAAQVIPEVQAVYLTETPGDAARLITVIDAPRFDTATEHRVFGVELEALDAGGGACVEFHLINVQEIPGRLDDHLPNKKRLLFQPDALH